MCSVWMDGWQQNNTMWKRRLQVRQNVKGNKMVRESKGKSKEKGRDDRTEWAAWRWRMGWEGRGTRDSSVVLKWVCCPETTVGCRLLKEEDQWVDSSVTSLTQSWQHQQALAASVGPARKHKKETCSYYSYKSKKKKKKKKKESKSSYTSAGWEKFFFSSQKTS